VAHHLERLLKLENETEHLADPTATVIAPIFHLAVEVLSTIAELVCQWEFTEEQLARVSPQQCRQGPRV